MRAVVVSLSLAMVAVSLIATPVAAGKPDAVYTQTQDPDGNEVVVFHRDKDGTLTEEERVPTGGVGVAATPPFDFPILDSQGGVELSDNGKLLFVVNAGSNTVSSFRTDDDGLTLVDVAPTGGDLPVSVDSSKDLVYVLNEVSGTISGFWTDSRGNLTPIPDSIRPLSTPGNTGLAAQIGFDTKGRTLTVSLRGPSTIDTFEVGKDDRPGPVVTTSSPEETPFGFAYTKKDRLLVSNAGHVGNPPDPGDLTQFNGSVTGYIADGTALTDAGSTDADGRASCWVVITKDGKHAFVSNTLSNTISRFSLDSDGNATLLGTTPTSEPSLFDGGALATDMALSKDSKYLYVLSAIGGDGTSTMDAYRVGKHGELTLIQTLDSLLPVGMSGLAAR